MPIFFLLIRSEFIMNKWSFMRTIDENKIAQLEKATAEFVVNHGYGGASVGKIAEQAGVSKGYLYRFYKTKQELVQALLTRYIDFIVDEIAQRLHEDISTDNVISYLIHHIFNMAESNPNHIKFIYVLMHDYNFKLHENQREKIRNIIEKFHTKGIAHQSINAQIIPEEIFTIVLIYPIDFINLRFKNFFKKTMWNETDKDRIIKFCINALKN